MKIYTDGATSKNGYEGAKGSWAWVIIDDDNNIISKGDGHSNNVTNNQCELNALINACRMFNMIRPFDTVEVYSDSAYCINCYQQKWWEKWLKNGWLNSKKEPVANKELWESLIPYFENPNFNFNKVKGHADNYWNNYVDRMAVEARK